ncbi:hypothetical protein [Alcanivorax sp.]|uniref:hypothetical protein n=1 Tax=Alcanivorax sp. TaxID=1872427 RepID=UPI0025BC39C2|nr:hypothetical protein [Alcanivorax sp.]
MPQDKIDLDLVRREFENWQSFLNNTIGVLAFTLGLASLGTHSPDFNAALSVAFLLTVSYSARQLFPTTYKKLRDKKNKSEEEEIVFKGLTKHHFSIHKYAVYTLGYSFLVFIATSPHWETIFPALTSYIYGPLP